MIAECTMLGATVEEFDDYCITNLPAKHNGNVWIKRMITAWPCRLPWDYQCDYP